MVTEPVKKNFPTELFLASPDADLVTGRLMISVDGEIGYAPLGPSPMHEALYRLPGLTLVPLHIG
jgi:hypothetical protein